MKRLLFLLLIPFTMMGCQQIKSDLEDIKGRLSTLEGSTISSIEEQINSVKNAIKTMSEAQTSLENKDKELAGLIEKLQAYTKDADGQFTTIDNALAALNQSKQDLEAKDAELAGLINTLQGYLDESLSKEKDWIKATYSTLEQYQTVADEVSSLKESIKATYCTLEQYQGLSEELSSLREDYNTLKESFNTAGKEYDKKLSALEKAMKSWVGEALSGYYDIATMDAKLSAFATQESLREEIEEVQAGIDKAKEDLTESYRKAISEAILENNGVIDAKIAKEIATVQTRIDKEVADLNNKISGLEKRVKALEDMVSGLKVSDAIFGFVSYAQPDTITKGLPYLTTFRLNPSGVPFSLNMVVLDNMSSKKYLYRPATKASYITESKNFVPDSLGKTRNAANEETDGQYFLRLKTTEKRNLIDDNIFSLVGAYRDKESKIQYVSSTPFSLVMMPTPEEGLSQWSYSHGNVTHAEAKSIKLPGKEGEQPGEEQYIEVWTETLGDICYSFDHRNYVNETNENDTRTYSCENLRSFVYEGNSAKDSIIIFEPHRDSGYVRFLPDTTRAEWSALLDTTKHSTLKISGKIHAFDRYGGSSTFPVEMTWYSRYTDTLTVNVKSADFFEADGVTRKSVEVNLEQILKKRGYILSAIDGVPRKRSVRNIGSKSGSLITCSFAPGSETKVNLRTYATKERLSGTHLAIAVMTLVTLPSEMSEIPECQAVECPIALKIVVSE